MSERIDDETMKVASWICCPMCDEKECVGRYNCIEIKNYIARTTEKGGGEE